ncbi:MAG TPA: hypothetical protein PK156_06225 [Polyangium sp.]|nr:hypothetical protein [Polyangium sp.]
MIRTNHRVLTALAALPLMLATGHVQGADPKVEPTDKPLATNAPAGWAGELDALSKWIAQRDNGGKCAARCFVLERLRLSGSVGEGPLEFELTGRVLADGAVDIPLFGPPKDVRLEDVTENDKDAAIGFEQDRYFLHTSARKFVLRGKMILGTDLAVLIPGPLNTLESNFSSGAVVEGTRLSGLTNATIHLSRQEKAAESGPTVFQLSRAVRVGRETTFEYRLVMRSGKDLGVVRLPLSLGEKVLDVTGAAGFRVEEGELVLPTSGRSAEMTITGTLAKFESILVDSRSPYEWWLVESDPEHRVIVSGEARQVDSAESPIPRTQPTSRLFLVQKGQKMSANVTTLAAVDALAAVVQSHNRTVVMTARGDVVSDDHLNYENNGVDYLAYDPGGRPIYLATAGKAERIMRQGNESQEILIPLKTGSQNVRAQSLTQAGWKPFVGSVEIPMPSYALTASRVNLTVGLPTGYFPLALLGGDRPKWAVEGSDLLGAGMGFLIGAAAVRPGTDTPPKRLRAIRILAGVLLAALWFLWNPGFVLTLVGLSLLGLIWLVGRFLKGPARVATTFVLLGGLGLLVLLFGFAATSRAPMKSESLDYEPSRAASPAPMSDVTKADVDARTGNWMGGKEGGVLQGVTPVPLPLPSYRHSMYSSRELVTKDRPFRPVMFYMTDSVALPIGFLWLAGLAILVRAHWKRVMDVYGAIKAKMGAGDEKPEVKEEAK